MTLFALKAHEGIMKNAFKIINRENRIEVNFTENFSIDNLQEARHQAIELSYKKGLKCILFNFSNLKELKKISTMDSYEFGAMLAHPLENRGLSYIAVVPKHSTLNEYFRFAAIVGRNRGANIEILETDEPI